MKRNILLTGPPRCGKSTLIERIIRKMEKPMKGFFTRELREGGKRTGFSIVTLDGREGLLAHQKIKRPYRVGKYVVNLDDIDQIAVPSMIPESTDQVIIIDEIGRMECFSDLFRKTLLKVLGSENPVIGTIAEKGGPFIQKIKARNDVSLIKVTDENRDQICISISHYSEKM